MEKYSDEDIRSIGDAIRRVKRQEHSACKRRLTQMGFSKVEAEIACAALLLKEDQDETTNDPDNDFMLLFTDEDCVSNKIKIFHKEHGPGTEDVWSHDKIVAAAHGYCRKHGDSRVIEMVKKIGGKEAYGSILKSTSVVLRRLSGIVNLIKSKTGMKVGHAGLPPFLTSLPMKNLNRLQTKLERMTTEEEKFITAEQQSQRAQYATTMKKQDSELYQPLIDYFTDSMWITDQIELGKANTDLNNIIKAPVIIAREMVQTYYFTNEDGSVRSEEHFKPYEELKIAIEDLKELPMLIEHHDQWDEDLIIGYVRQLVADDKLRCIRGMAYFDTNKLPPYLLSVLKATGKVGVSIGFLAELGDAGIWNELVYDHTQKNFVLQHLAICLESKPRCPLDQCGINIEDQNIHDNIEFTIINKENCYYNINKISEETRTENKHLELKIKSDSMTEDSFADPKSGKISGDEPKDLETVLSWMRRYLNGVRDDLLQKDFAKKRIRELLSMTDEVDEGEDETSNTLEGEDKMDEKEFQDAIAEKDAEIARLEEFVKKALIGEIQSFMDADAQSKAKLDEKCIHDLEVIRDTVLIYKPIEKEAEVLPVESPEELKDEAEERSKAKRIDSSKVFAKTNEEFELDGISFIEE